MDLTLLAERESNLLGREFLTWLWFESEHRDAFESADGSHFVLSFEKRISVEGGEGETLQQATVSGQGTEMSEAMAGLRTGKKVAKAFLKIAMDQDEWTLTLSAKDFAVSGLKTPKVEGQPEEGEDPDALFLEKVFLVERCLSLVDELYLRFVKLRLSSDWGETVAAMRSWIG
ncbi:MAG: hypothetical protein AB7D07_07070 [Desulfovibrionaceae bacterium]